MRKRIFIGSSRESMGACRAIQQEFERDFDTTVWDQDVFRPTYDAIDSLQRLLDGSDAGVFVLTADDLTLKRGRTDPAVRDNVIFELGMFLGRLGRGRTFMVAPRGVDMHLPTDLSGVTVVWYDGSRLASQPRAAVGAACSQVTQAINDLEPEITPEPLHRVRLDHALTLMSRDLESLTLDRPGAPAVAWPGAVPVPVASSTVHLEVGRIEDYHPAGSRQVILLPANEYFDDGCIDDSSGSLGAFVARHFSADVPGFKAEIAAQLSGVPSRRVLRSGRRTAESYGIGEAVFLNGLAPDFRIILASVTTEQDGVGLHAEPHFLYAAFQGVVEKMNEHRLNSLVLPVLGSGHGEISLATAILFNLLALRSVLRQNPGRHVKDVRLVVFTGDAARISPEQIGDIVSRVTLPV
ncbi:MAG TPA: TIR domain-containing protein [Actinoplanes sp.]|nr:TIR domain-containing protein [Actinoplanes sp.]